MAVAPRESVLINFLCHFLLKFRSLLLVGKRQPRDALFQLKGVEECAVGVVLEAFVDLLIP